MGTNNLSTTLIEDHALIGDLHTSALINRNGTIDFMCVPDFDSGACFASLLGTPENGEWKLSPVEEIIEMKRQYRGNTLVLETELTTASGSMRITDFMPIRKEFPFLVRIVECMKGTIKVHHKLKPRFSNGYTEPIISERTGATVALAGPDSLYLRSCDMDDTYAETIEPMETEFELKQGERKTFALSWSRPYEEAPHVINPAESLSETIEFWEDWVSGLHVPMEHKDVLIRSLITLKACMYEPTGAIVAAPTFGLPESPGGERNWDYRFCWLRDSVLTLSALLNAGKIDEANSFGGWLVNAVGGSPSQIQIMYGIRGERHLNEFSLDWLKGFGDARPVRVGNGAFNQFQLDVLGELASLVYLKTQITGELLDRAKIGLEDVAAHVEKVWRDPDHGIWEMRGPKQNFTSSKVAAWAAVDRWIRIIDQFKIKTDRAHWANLRKTMFDEICEKGYDPVRNTFTQYYGSKSLDASLLALPLIGFLPFNDERILGTIKAIEEDLLVDGFVLRYRTESGVDGLQGEEGVFLACSFWLANCYKLMGREEDAIQLFERLISLRNDVGLLAEEYLTKEKIQIGNFPQAFSHLALVNSAFTLFGQRRPVPYVKDSEMIGRTYI